jgi:ABC-type transport system involved in multi-copper enzyme maturation permease subunit
MNAVFTLAGLTVREAVRRKFIVAGLLICALFAVVAYIPIHPRATVFFSADEYLEIIAAETASLGASMVAFFSFLFAVSLGAGSISNEIERGVMSVIVPKPISRASIYFGKWLGLNLFILPFTALWTAMLQWAIAKHVGHVVPGLWHALPILALYPVVFTALTLMFSALTSTLLATILPFIIASTAWSEVILNGLSARFDIQTLKVLGKVVVYLAPLNPLSRWVERMLDQPIIERIAAVMHPNMVPDPPAHMRDLVWILAYAAATLVVGLVVFQRRDLGA